MNTPIQLIVPALLSAATAALVSFSITGPSPTPPREADAFSGRADGDLAAEFAALRRAQAEQTKALEELSLRFTTLELRPVGESREPVLETALLENNEDLVQLAAALSKKGDAPEAFGEWLEGQLAAREDARKTERRDRVRSALDDMLAERIDDLAERLELAPHQTNEVESILSTSIADVSTVIAEADSPIEIMQGIAPIQRERNAQLEAVLTPDQFESFKKEESSFRGPGLPFGPGSR